MLVCHGRKQQGTLLSVHVCHMVEGGILAGGEDVPLGSQNGGSIGRAARTGAESGHHRGAGATHQPPDGFHFRNRPAYQHP